MLYIIIDDSLPIAQTSPRHTSFFSWVFVFLIIYTRLYWGCGVYYIILTLMCVNYCKQLTISNMNTITNVSIVQLSSSFSNCSCMLCSSTLVAFRLTLALSNLFPFTWFPRNVPPLSVLADKLIVAGARLFDGHMIEQNPAQLRQIALYYTYYSTFLSFSPILFITQYQEYVSGTRPPFVFNRWVFFNA